MDQFAMSIFSWKTIWSLRISEPLPRRQWWVIVAISSMFRFGYPLFPLNMATATNHLKWISCHGHLQSAASRRLVCTRTHLVGTPAKLWRPWVLGNSWPMGARPWAPEVKTLTQNYEQYWQLGGDDHPIFCSVAIDSSLHRSPLEEPPLDLWASTSCAF